MQSTQNWFSSTHNPFAQITGLIFKEGQLRRVWANPIPLSKGNAQHVQPPRTKTLELTGLWKSFVLFCFVLGSVWGLQPLVHHPSLTMLQIRETLYLETFSLQNHVSTICFTKHRLSITKGGVTNADTHTPPTGIILSFCSNVYVIPLINPCCCCRAALQMPPLNLATVNLFAKRDPLDQTVDAIVWGRRVGQRHAGKSIIQP